MNKITCYIIAAIAILLITACDVEKPTNQTEVPTLGTIDIGDGGLFSNNPCGPPCFMDINPGITGYDDVINILKTRHYIDICKEFNNENDGGDRGIKCTNLVVISFDNNMKYVKSLGFNPTSSITIRTIIDKFGVPSSVAVMTGGYSKTVSVMRVYYNKYRMSILLDEQDRDYFDVKPDTKVHTIGYEDENSYQETTKFTKRWNGFGKYIMQ